MSGLDIRYIEEYSVPRVRHWSWRSSLVVVSYYIFLYLLDCGLSLFDCCLHLFYELVHHFQSRGLLPGFKVYMRSLSSVEQEQNLLNRWIHVVVVLELCHGQQVIPVILSLIDEELQILIQLLVDMFCLSIGLQMPSSGRNQLYFQQSVEFPDEKYHKLESVVQNYMLGQPVKLLYIVEELL